VVLILLPRTPTANLVLLSANYFINQLKQSGWISKNSLLRAELARLRCWAQVVVSVTSVAGIRHRQTAAWKAVFCAVCCSVPSRDRIAHSRQAAAKPQTSGRCWAREVPKLIAGSSSVKRGQKFVPSFSNCASRVIYYDFSKSATLFKWNSPCTSPTRPPNS
jgi:hypothetical protein